MVEEYWLGIIRWFESRITNGLLEGLNSLVQAAKCRARGYRATRNYIAMIFSPSASSTSSPTRSSEEPNCSAAVLSTGRLAGRGDIRVSRDVSAGFRSCGRCAEGRPTRSRPAATGSWLPQGRIWRTDNGHPHGVTVRCRRRARRSSRTTSAPRVIVSVWRRRRAHLMDSRGRHPARVTDPLEQGTLHRWTARASDGIKRFAARSSGAARERGRRTYVRRRCGDPYDTLASLRSVARATLVRLLCDASYARTCSTTSGSAPRRAAVISATFCSS